MSFTTATLGATTLALMGLLGGTVDPQDVMGFALWITAFLCILNICLAIFYRKQSRKEVISYYVVVVFELAVFVFALLFTLGIITQEQIPYKLPPNLPINRAEIIAALAFGIGLFPAAYWHGINLKEIPKRLADDAKAMKSQEAGVRIRERGPDGWVN